MTQCYLNIPNALNFLKILPQFNKHTTPLALSGGVIETTVTKAGKKKIEHVPKNK